MKPALKLLLATVCTTALGSAAFADSFINGSFESGTLSGWTTGGGYWSGGSYPVADDFLPGGSQYSPSYAVISVTNVGTDPLTDNVLNTVFAGAHSAQVNDYYNDNSVSVISQRVNNYTDPLIAFSYAAVLESSHGATDSDAFIITLTDATTAETIYSFNLNSATAPGVFTQSSSGWFYSDWISESIDVSLRSGHDFVLSLLANDCPYGGHAGYAYLDGFGSTEGGGGTGGGGGQHFWDGDAAGNAANGLVDGGNGIWSVVNTNWTDASGAVNSTPDASVIFMATPGTVTIDNSAGAVTVSDMTFNVDGYVINGDALTLGGTAASIDVSDDLATGAVYTATIDANVTGSALLKYGLGNLVLNGDNTFSDVDIFDGTLTVGSNTAAGIGIIAMEDGATLANNKTVTLANDVVTVANGRIDALAGTTLTLDGVISGGGSIDKNGTGKLIVNGVNSYTGATSVNAGELAVMGSTATSTITVQRGATLSGNGTTGSVIALGGSFVAPGASIGTLHIAGDYSLASGSTLLNQLTSTGSSDLVAATGAATLAPGAIINVSKLDSARYVLGTRYTVLSAANGVSGKFTLTGNTNVSAFIDVIGTYDATHAYLNVAQTHSFASAGSTPNQIAAATGADTGSGTLFTAIAYLPTFAAAQAAFDAISGEIYPTTTGISFEDSRFVREAVTDHLVSPATGPHAGHAIWGRAFGSWATIDSDNNAAKASRDIGGFFIGGDIVNNGALTVGVLAGYDHAKIKVDDRASSASADDYHIAAYGGFKSGAWGLQMGTAYAWRDLNTYRSVGFSGFSDALSASYQQRIWQIFGDASYRFDLSSVGIEPFFNLAYVSISTDNLTESGGPAALRVWQDTSGVTVMTLGSRLRANISGSADIFASAGWRHAGGDTATFATMQLAGGGTPFTIAGLPIAQDAAALELGVGFKVGTSGKFDIGYSGQIGDGVSDNGVQATFSWAF